MSQVTVFSECPYPINGMAYGKPNQDTKVRPKIGEYRITPGQNYIDADVWAIAKKIPQIEKRLANGRLIANHNPTRANFDVLRGSASRTYINELSVKAGPISSDEPIFGAGNQRFDNKPDRTIQDMSAQIAKLEAMVQKLSSNRE